MNCLLDPHISDKIMEEKRAKMAVTDVKSVPKKWYGVGLILLAFSGFSALFGVHSRSGSVTLGKGKLPGLLRFVTSEDLASSLHPVELQQISCLTKVAVIQLKEQYPHLRSSLVDFQQSLPLHSTGGASGVEAKDFTLDATSFWSPTDPRIVAGPILQRIKKSETSRDIIPLILYSGAEAQEATRARNIIQSIKNLASFDSPSIKIHSAVDGSDTETLQLELKSRIANLNVKSGRKITIFILGSVEKFQNFVDGILNRPEIPSWVNSTIWVHQNAFDLVQSLTAQNDKILDFLDQVGFTTALFYPATKFLDVDLRKFNFILKSQSCEVTSVQRAFAFVESIKQAVLRKIESPEEFQLTDEWEAWTLFIGGRQYRQIVDTIQDTPWLVDETYKVAPSSLESFDKGSVHVEISDKHGGFTPEIIKKQHLLQVYAPLLLSDCEKIGEIVIDTKDPFTLRDHRRNFTKPEDFPEVVIIPSNHGMVVSVHCSATSKGSSLAARITCSGDPKTPCVHSTFLDNEKLPSKRTKRGIMEARQLLAALDAQKAPYVIGRPVVVHPFTGVRDDLFQKRMSIGNDNHKNDSFGGEEQNLNKKVPYRVRQKAALVYKVLYDEGLNSEQMLKALPTVIASPAVRKEAEKLIRGLPDTRMLQVISSRQGSPTGGKPPKYPLPPYAKWLLGGLGSITACLGTSVGSLLCSITSESAGLPIAVAACHQGGMLHMASSCHVMIGRLFQAVADDNSVICTALHSENLLEDFAYVVDSSFGQQLQDQDPMVLEGYHTMATPVVNLMKASDNFARAVKIVSRPWIDQMMFESGYLETETLAGRLILDYGLNVARMVGYSKKLVENGLFYITGGPGAVSCQFTVLSLSSAFVAGKLFWLRFGSN